VTGVKMFSTSEFSAHDYIAFREKKI